MNCKNCGQTTEGNYCSHCGQKSNVARITFSNLLTQLSGSILQVDRGFFYTLKELFTRPGGSINEYLDGKRKKHFKPIAYVIILSTVYFLVSQISGLDTFLGDMLGGFSEGWNDGDESVEISGILNWLQKNYAYTTLLLLPVFSLASYICFQGLGRNYFEHIVINSLTTGQQAIFYTVFVVISFIFDNENLMSLAMVFFILYNVWVFCQLFNTKNRMAIIVRSILTYALFLIFGMGISIILVGIISFTN